jgi:site-specific recombinase XerD
MIRTGLRLEEQTALTMFELPDYEPGLLNFRSRLPNAIAKGGAGRIIYIPASVLKDVWDYVEIERAEAVEYARSRRLYEQIKNPYIVDDHTRPMVRYGDNRIKVSSLDPDERERLLIDTAHGLEPAALWLNERGMPMAKSGWQQMFDDANDRCGNQRVPLRTHPHALRHSYAVITLEQLWRGHLQALGEMNTKQRETYQMIFGDPLNWIRIRLGHASIVTTQIYMHTLQELEIETRLALVPDDAWEPSGYCDEGFEEALAA